MNENKAPVMIPVEKLHPFTKHPYKIIDNDEMNRLIDSIQEQGILSPLIVRPLENTADEYEIVSGHRRLRAAEKAGIKEVPAAILLLDKDAAAIAVVDSNLHREHILPSEKAFAYKLKMDAMSHQGKTLDTTSDQVGPKLTADEISDTESASQVKRYIRLTHLIEPLLQKIDDGKIAFNPAVELSFLAESEQQDLLDAMDYYDCTPSHAQAIQFKKLSKEGNLSGSMIDKILSEPKPNQKEKISFKTEDLYRFFPKNYTAADIQKSIVQMIEADFRRRQRNRDDGAR